MPNVPEVSLLKVLIRAGFFARMAPQAAVLAKTLFTNNFSGCCPGTRTKSKNQVRRAKFPKD
jgi:hypothetical protein